jgi:hypothetical protein
MKPHTGYKKTEDTRIWCEYCKIFVYNNRINREKHDKSPQHQANSKKKIEQLRKEESQAKKDSSLSDTSSSSKSFYYNNSASSKPVEISNILNIKSSLTNNAVKRPVLGLSTFGIKAEREQSSANLNNLSVVENSIKRSSVSIDVKSSILDLKRKALNDEKATFDMFGKDEKNIKIEETNAQLEIEGLFKKKKPNKPS